MNNKTPSNPLSNISFASNSSGSSNSSSPSAASKNSIKKTLVIVGLCAGIILIVLSFITSNNNNNNNSSKNKNTATNTDLSRTDAESYAAEQENKICEILKRIDGVTDPYVMITLDTSSEYIYASNESIKESGSNSGETTQREVQQNIVIYDDTKDSKSPILIKEIQPKIKGVAVICKGIRSADLQLKIVNLVSTVLNLPTKKTALKSEQAVTVENMVVSGPHHEITLTNLV
ncbi:MAG: hypothetical protein FWD71_10860, partial [Oscillospiraceae bacterium]|nr:hypothetical protein [Oscillospiraceae bacterium]